MKQYYKLGTGDVLKIGDYIWTGKANKKFDPQDIEYALEITRFNNTGHEHVITSNIYQCYYREIQDPLIREEVNDRRLDIEL